MNNSKPLNRAGEVERDAVAGAAGAVRTILEEAAMEMDRGSRRYSYLMGVKVADPNSGAYAEAARLIRSLC